MCYACSACRAKAGVHPEVSLPLTHTAVCCNSSGLIECRLRQEEPLVSLLFCAEEMPK